MSDLNHWPAWHPLDPILMPSLFVRFCVHTYWHVDIPMFASIKNHAGKLLEKNKLQNTADAKQTPNLPSNTTTMRPVAFSDSLCRKWIFVSLWIIIAFVGMELTSIWNHQEVQLLLLLTTKGNLPRCQHGIQELLHTPPHHGTHQSMLFCGFIKKKTWGFHGFPLWFRLLPWGIQRKTPAFVSSLPHAKPRRRKRVLFMASAKTGLRRCIHWAVTHWADGSERIWCPAGRKW